MTDEQLSSGVVQEGEGGPQEAADLSAGTMLQQIREAAGIDMVTVAHALRISPRLLQALEQDRYKELPDLSFARSLAASICRNFGVDPEPILARMPQKLVTGLPTPKRGINAPFYGASDRRAAVLPKYVSRPLTAVVVLLLLGSLLLWLWPTLPVRLSDGPPDAHTAASTASQTPGEDGVAGNPSTVMTDRSELGSLLPSPADAQSEADLPGPASQEDEDEPRSGPSSQAEALPETGDDEQVEGISEQATPASDTGDEAAGAGIDGTGSDGEVLADAAGDHADSARAAATATADDEPPGDLVIAASNGESWVSVRDRTGQTLFNRLLEKGETARISGDRPLSATIGRKEAVTVLVHGEPFDHRAQSNSSVSRFKVN